MLIDLLLKVVCPLQFCGECVAVMRLKLDLVNLCQKCPGKRFIVQADCQPCPQHLNFWNKLKRLKLVLRRLKLANNL
jgi:hypothetical protein